MKEALKWSQVPSLYHPDESSDCLKKSYLREQEKHHGHRVSMVDIGRPWRRCHMPRAHSRCKLTCIHEDCARHVGRKTSEHARDAFFAKHANHTVWCVTVFPALDASIGENRAV